MQLERYVPPAFEQSAVSVKPATKFNFKPLLEKEAPPSAPPSPPSFSESDLKNAEASGYRKGYVEGEAEGRKIAESEMVNLDRSIEKQLAPIAEQILLIFKSYNKFVREQTALAPQLALSLAKKISANALSQDSLTLIEPIAKECISRVLGEAVIVVTVHEKIASRLEEKLIKYFSSSNEPGEIIINGDAMMEETDCKIKWAHGQANISQADRLRELDKIVAEIRADIAHKYTEILPLNKEIGNE